VHKVLLTHTTFQTTFYALIEVYPYKDHQVRAINPAYSDNYKKHINTICG